MRKSFCAIQMEKDKGPEGKKQQMEEVVEYLEIMIEVEVIDEMLVKRNI